MKKPSQNQTASLLHEGRFSALEIAKCLLSFDPTRQYFTKNLISFEGDEEIEPTEGNFRLNKILHMCQIFYCIKHKKPLFRETMIAFKHGAIIYDVYMSFHGLYKLINSPINLDKKTRDFVHSIFKYFGKEDNKILRDFSHEDPAWELGCEQGGLMPLNNELISYYVDFFDDTLKEIEEIE